MVRKQYGIRNITVASTTALGNTHRFFKLKPILLRCVPEIFQSKASETCQQKFSVLLKVLEALNTTQGNGTVKIFLLYRERLNMCLRNHSCRQIRKQALLTEKLLTECQMCVEDKLLRL